MGYIFEDIIRRFSENAEAGDHYTPREVIRLMTNVLLAEGCNDLLTEEGKVATVLDAACGSGGMLSTAFDFLRHYNKAVDVRLFGQEINPESYAICLADMLIKGQDTRNIIGGDAGNTLMRDCFPNQKARLVIMNPPFGTPWGGKDAAEGVEDAVNEGQRKFMGTFWNTYAFYILYADIDKFDPTKYKLEYDKLSAMDKWALSKLNSLIKFVDKNLNEYKITESYGFECVVFNKRYTGMVKNNYGFNKLEIVKKIEKDIGKKPFFAIGDSESDFPMLDSAYYGFLMNQEITNNNYILVNEQNVLEQIKKILI